MNDDLERGLGRLHAPDERDRKYLLSLPPEIKEVAENRTHRYHYYETILDQGNSSACTGAAFWQWADMGPIRNHNKPDFMTLYKMNQKVDEWPGEEPLYEGSSVRASFRVGQQLGFVKSYRWAFDLETVVNHLLTVGPVVLGTDWTRDAMRTDEHGFVHFDGSVVGGHAYTARGASRVKRCPDGSLGGIRCLQSWGDAWGENGLFWISFKDMEKLIKANGEACTAFEQLAPAQPA